MIDLIVTIFILWPLITILYYWNVAVKLRLAERRAEVAKKTNPWTEPIKDPSAKHGTPKPRVVFVEVEEEVVKPKKKPKPKPDPEDEGDWEIDEILEDAKPAGKHIYDPKQHKVVWVPAE